MVVVIIVVVIVVVVDLVVVVRTWCMTCVSVHAANGMQLIKTDRRQSLRLIDQPDPTTPVASGCRFQASPGAKYHPTPRRGKRLRGSPTSPPTPSRKGAHSFPSPWRWMPRVRIRTCLPGQPDPLTCVTTLIQEMTRSNRLLFTIPITNPG